MFNKSINYTLLFATAVPLEGACVCIYFFLYGLILKEGNAWFLHIILMCKDDHGLLQILKDNLIWIS